MRIDMASSFLCNSQKPWQRIKFNVVTVSVSYLCGGQEQEEQVVSRAAEMVDSQGHHLIGPSIQFSSASSKFCSQS